MIINKRLSKKHQELVKNKNFLNNQNYVISPYFAKKRLLTNFSQELGFFGQWVYVLFNVTIAIVFTFIVIICLPICILDIIFKTKYAEKVFSFLAMIYNSILKKGLQFIPSRYVFRKQMKKNSFLIFKKPYEK